MAFLTVRTIEIKISIYQKVQLDLGFAMDLESKTIRNRELLSLALPSIGINLEIAGKSSRNEEAHKK